MLKKIFLPWLVIADLEQELHVLRFEEAYLKRVVDQLMAERVSLRPKRDARGRFTK